eukprot:NODE_24545_length_620_cov_6.829615.p2 GENE.NODE_24545_length_620_cov_6.829615~~NODE_24545_length_620_cov_6.829615.p2  ORF type:complete len:166 (-),score=47.54 NODE_24545_length_620_cov_6.829615:123-596(-)
MCATLTVYCFMYVAFGKALPDDSKDGTSVYDPLTPLAALALLATSISCSVIVCGAIDLLMPDVLEHLRKRDVPVLGVLDELSLGSLQALTQASAASLIESLAFIIGMAVHGIVMSLWSHAESAATLTNIGGAVGFALVISILAGALAAFGPSPPKTL